MAFYDPGKLMICGAANAGDPIEAVIDGRVIYGSRGPANIKRLPEKVRRAIVGWGWDRNQNFTIKLADKSKALDYLARHLSLYNDKLEVAGLDALAERLARASKRMMGNKTNFDAVSVRGSGRSSTGGAAYHQFRSRAHISDARIAIADHDYVFSKRVLWKAMPPLI
jgi:hypothetical protein